MENTSGFYKLDGDLLYGPNFVLGPYGAYELRKEKHVEYEYPIDGWYWFNSLEEAKTFFNISVTSEVNE
jgi:hypothetical protein